MYMSLEIHLFVSGIAVGDRCLGMGLVLFFAFLKFPIIFDSMPKS